MRPSRPDILLVSPPVSNFGQAAAAPSVLVAYLRARGWDARQLDVGIDAFHRLHTAGHLAGCRRALEAAGAGEEVVGLARRVEADIEGAKQALCRPGIEAEPDAMRDAFGTIRAAGDILTAAAGGRYELSFRHFTIPGAHRSFAALDAALAEGERNPFLADLTDHALGAILAEQPRAVGISITYMSQLLPGLTLARLLRARAPGLALALGGAYLTSIEGQLRGMPSTVAPVDLVVVHDGEDALDAWLGAVLRGRGRAADVPNALLPEGGHFERTGSRELVHTDLAAAPAPLWTGDGLRPERYLVPRYAVPLPLARGCYWGRCHYCNISSQTLGTYRFRPVERALEDVRAAMRGIGTDAFDLPVDSVRPKDLDALARAILAAGLDLEWGAEVLLDRGFTPERLELLARSGCRSLRFGLESACRRTLEAMNKPTRPETAAAILEGCRRAGIATGVMLIVGFPTETQRELYETFAFLEEHAGAIDHLTFHQFALVPGSKMADDPGAFGLVRQPARAVLWPSLPFANANPVAMRSEDLPRVIDAMREGLAESYRDLGELWTLAIGGWMTFEVCCHLARQRRRERGDGGRTR